MTVEVVYRRHRASVIAREAERRGGELLKAMELQKQTRVTNPGPGRGNKTDCENEQTVFVSGATVSNRRQSPLKSLGLTPADSRRMHAAAALGEDVAERRRRLFATRGEILALFQSARRGET